MLITRDRRVRSSSSVSEVLFKSIRSAQGKGTLTLSSDQLNQRWPTTNAAITGSAGRELSVRAWEKSDGEDFAPNTSQIGVDPCGVSSLIFKKDTMKIEQAIMIIIMTDFSWTCRYNCEDGGGRGEREREGKVIQVLGVCFRCFEAPLKLRSKSLEDFCISQQQPLMRLLALVLHPKHQGVSLFNKAG